MRADLVVLPKPYIDGDLSLFGCVKPFGVEDLVWLSVSISYTSPFFSQQTLGPVDFFSAIALV